MAESISGIQLSNKKPHAIIRTQVLGNKSFADRQTDERTDIG